MLLRLIEYQDWRKIGMADMLGLVQQPGYPSSVRTLFSRLCGPIRQNMREYAPS